MVFNKCEYAKQLLTKPKLKTTITYLDPTDEEAPEESAVSCVIDVKDEYLDTELEQSGHVGSHYGAISSFKIHKTKGIEASDVVMNTENCHKLYPPTFNAISLKDLVGCSVEEIHVHGGKDRATHLHISCPKSDNTTIANFTRTIVEAFDIGRRFCGIKTFQEEDVETLFPRGIK